MKNRFLSILTGLSMLVPSITSAAFGIQVIIDGQTIVFSDVPQSAWFATYVRSAAEAGIVSGYRDNSGKLTGMFGPSNNITIAEALKIAVEGAGYDEQFYASRIDSGVTHWSSPYVAVAKAERFAVINARTRLDWPATRADVAAIFTSAFRVSPFDTTLGERFTDVDARTENAGSIEALSRDGVVSGDTDIHGKTTGKFRPTQNINRAEVAKMVMNARTAYGVPGNNRTPTEMEGDAQLEENVVTYTNDGFSPQVLHVTVGTAVTFKNESGEDMWIASNPHPTHTNLPALDANTSMGPGEIYVYTFSKAGTWGYHNHANASLQGTIIVEE
jgi:plastocyanin